MVGFIVSSWQLTMVTLRMARSKQRASFKTGIVFSGLPVADEEGGLQTWAWLKTIPSDFL